VTALADTPWGLFVATQSDGVFRCDSVTGRWESVSLGAFGAGPVLFVPAPTPRVLVGMWRPDVQTPATVWASEDQGQTWAPWDGGLAEQYHGQRAHSLSLDPGKPERLFLGLSASILRSLDGGRTWDFVLGDPEWAGAGVSAILVSPAQDGYVWAAVNSSIGLASIGRSPDWGDTWKGVAPFETGDYAIMNLAADRRDPNRLWAPVSGRFSGVIRSEDSGKTWEPVLTASHAFVAVLSDEANLYAIGYRDVGLPPDGEPPRLTDLALYHSADWGSSWCSLSVPSEASGAWVARFDLQGRMLIGTRLQGGGVWRFEP
jgi:photosystem II stability/assembly factor-like uncharacterized protein